MTTRPTNPTDQLPTTPATHTLGSSALVGMLASGLVLIAGQAQAGPFPPIVVIDNIANAPDPLPLPDGTSGWGSVFELYGIGKYPITNEQYVEFLNAVASSDPHGLFDPFMDVPPASKYDEMHYGSIGRSGSPRNYQYFLKPGLLSPADHGRGDLPVLFITLPRAMRYCNWLHNGMPIGAQDATTTEDGSYSLIGADSLTVQRNPWSTWVVPSENEWHKAAYGGPGDLYSKYALATNVVPEALLCGIGPPFVDQFSINAARFDALWIFQPTPVGCYPGSSFHGAFDMHGNVWEWTQGIAEQPDGSMRRILRGGDMRTLHQVDAERDRLDAVPEFNGSTGFGFGFRIALRAVGPCPGDVSGSADPNSPDYGEPDGTVDAIDFFYYLDQFAQGNVAVADLTGSANPTDPRYSIPDGVLDASDFFVYLVLFTRGC